jgi:glucose-6-phosphate isomerase
MSLIIRHFVPEITASSADLAHLETGLLSLKDTLPLFNFIRQDKDIALLSPIVPTFNQFKHVIVLGTGGSSLGGKALCELAESNTPQLNFYDNIDPHTFKRLFQTLDLETTGVIVMSKSGTTAETLMQFMVLLNQYQEKSLPLKDHFIIITELPLNPMRQLAASHDIPVLEHPADIGGRFAVFTLVGLLPALIAGVDGASFRQGALECLIQWDTDLLDHAAIRGALIHYKLAQRGKTISVLMPYIDRLMVFAQWYRQLWAESLGKNRKGTTPLTALGTVDQHSQLQLFLDGPKDKFFTVLTTDHNSADFRVVPPPEALYLAIFEDKTMGDLLMAEQQATIDTLINNDCPVRHFHLPKVDAHSLGYLMMHFVIETLAMSILLKVNAFDQPAVEESKILTRQYLRRGKKED